MSLPVAQLAWMAGVIDLKGKIIYKNNKARATRQIVLYVESTQIAIVRELARMIGTNPEMKKVPDKADFYRRPCTDHCPTEHSHVNAEFPQVARWTVSGAAAAVVLLNLAPYMRVDKGFDAVIIQIFEQATLSGQGSAATIAALRRLENLGWTLPTQFSNEINDKPLALASA